MNGWMDGCIDLTHCTHTCKSGMDGWMDEWMDGWMERQKDLLRTSCHTVTLKFQTSGIHEIKTIIP